MKKNILVAAVLALLGAGNAFAYVGPNPITGVMNTAASTFTVSGVDISSFTGTSVIVSTSAAYRAVCVQNTSASVSLFCGDTANVSTMTANSLAGISVSPANTACFAIAATMDFFCRTGSQSASTRATIVRTR